MHIWGKGRRAFLEFINRVIWSSALPGAVYLFNKHVGANDLLGQSVIGGLCVVWLAVLAIAIREYWDDLARALPPEAIAIRSQPSSLPDASWFGRFWAVLKIVFQQKKSFFLDFVIALAVPLLTVTAAIGTTMFGD